MEANTERWINGGRDDEVDGTDFNGGHWGGHRGSGT
jgi:hypothetical protein